MGSLFDGPRSLPGSTRYRNLMPNNAPCYVRCYDDGGKSFDRYTVVFSRVENHPYLAMSAYPFHPQGFGQHGEDENGPIDAPTYGHLGKKICFADLPVDCQILVVTDYAAYWHLDVSKHPLVAMSTTPWDAPRPAKGKFDSTRREGK